MSKMKLKQPKSKAGRRGNNEGSIYQRKSDGLWCGAVTTGYKTDGKPMRKTLYGKTRQEVAKKVTALSGDVFENGYTTVSAREERNFQVLMQEWFDLFNAPNIASTTEHNRRNLMKNHLFKLFLRYGVRKRFIRENPMDDVVIRCKVQYVARGSGKEKALREEIREKVFTGVAENPILKPRVLVFTFTGLRPQELLALEWRHVDFSRKALSVKQAVNRVYEFDVMGNKVSSGINSKMRTLRFIRSVIPSLRCQWKKVSTLASLLI